MKTIITLLICSACITSFGQDIKLRLPQFSNAPKCGTWEELPPSYSEWFTVDTIGDRHHARSSARIWVYDEEKMISNNYSLANYCPCGCGNSNVYEQYRICSVTGIRQRRIKTVSYKYNPPPKSEYENVLDSLIK